MSVRYLKNVVTLTLDQDLCISCQMCATVCPHRVFRVNGKAQIVDRDACMECGACAKNCPVAAISVRSGVGCVTAVLLGAVRGDQPNCDCSSGPTCCGG